MKYFTVTVMLATVIMVNRSDAQQPMPGAAEQAKITFLAGNFTTEIIIPPTKTTPKGMTAKGTSVISWGLDSAYLSIEDTSNLFGGYRARGPLAYDVKTRQFVLSLSNNFGDRPMYFGNFTGDTLVLKSKIKSPKGAFDQKILWYKDDTTVRMKVFNDSGKGFVLTLDQTATPVVQKGK